MLAQKTALPSEPDRIFFDITLKYLLLLYISPFTTAFFLTSAIWHTVNVILLLIITDLYWVFCHFLIFLNFHIDLIIFFESSIICILYVSLPIHLPGAGVFFLSCSEGEQISFLFDCIVRGINPSRAPHGLRPSLPGEHAYLHEQTHKLQTESVKNSQELHAEMCASMNVCRNCATVPGI